MGRLRTKNLNLPDRMRARMKNGTTYYSYDLGGVPRKEVSLGTDYVLAIQKWAEIHEAAPTVRMTVGWVIAQYKASPAWDDVSTGTQADYGYAFDKLVAKFADAPLDEVKPSHITIYIDQRSKESKHRALREKAVLSMIFTWAIARDYCKVNPVAAIRTKRLPGRKNIYIEDDMFESVYKHGSVALRDAIDLAFYLGQRPADVLKLSETHIRGDEIVFGQNKGGKPMRIESGGDLAQVLKRMAERKKKFPVRSLQLLVDEHGKPMTKAKLRSRFENAREAAGIEGKDFQFRDLRRKAAADLRDQADIYKSQALLGHTNVEMTEHYAAGKGRRVTVLPKKGGG